MTYDHVLLDIRYNRGEYTGDKSLVNATIWFLQNLQDAAEIPGMTRAKMMGIANWYGEHQYLTEKQSRWLQIHLQKYEHCIDPMRAYA